MENSLKNKQISVNDILNFAKNLIDYDDEWNRKAIEDKEGYEKRKNTTLTKRNRRYNYYSSSVNYAVYYKDGRSIREKNIEWLKEATSNQNDVDYVSLHYNVNFTDNNKQLPEEQTVFISATARIHLGEVDGYKKNVVIEVNNKNLNSEADELHQRLTSIKNDLETSIMPRTNDSIIKIARIFEENKNSWDQEHEIEEEYIASNPMQEQKYKDFASAIQYTIKFYDGREITDKNLEWFEKCLKDTAHVKYASIDYNMHYFTSDIKIQTLNATISFSVYDITETSHARIRVDSNLEGPANELYSLILKSFDHCHSRYDSLIKHRNLITEVIAIAIGAILTYLGMGILKLFVENGDSILSTMTNTKTNYLFWYWMSSIIFGNTLDVWFINYIYKPMLPRKKYVGYDSKRKASIYKYKIDEYIEESEVHIGKYSSFPKRRSTLKALFKLSSLVVIIHVIVSVLIYLFL